MSKTRSTARSALLAAIAVASLGVPAVTNASTMGRRCPGIPGVRESGSSCGSATRALADELGQRVITANPGTFSIKIPRSGPHYMPGEDWHCVLHVRRSSTTRIGTARCRFAQTKIRVYFHRQNA